MPILIKDFIWTQSAATVQIKIPLKSNRSNVDIFTTDTYVKIHFNPFLFEIFLFRDVDNDRSKCIVRDDLILLDMHKRDEIHWDCLEKDLSKDEKRELRKEILVKCQEEAKERAEQRRIKKSQMDRYAVQQAMELDSKQHSLMDSRRDAERNKAMDKLESWRDTMDNDKLNSALNYRENNRTGYSVHTNVNNLQSRNETNVKIIELPPSDDERDEPKENEVTIEKTDKRYVKHSTSPNKSNKTPVRSEYVEKKKKEAAARVLPKLRETRELEIKHTPRTFPTPSRESAVQEEEAWLKNITQARRAIGFVSEDLRPEEQDPQWCKEKGDEFFRNGNYLGAISAYTHGVTLSDKLPSLYANRAAAHFALGNFNKCINDTSTALDLMKPPCEGNRRSRAKCIARRAAALARMGYLNKAIGEMKAAAKLLPEDGTIKKDIHDMERAWEQNPDSD